MEYSPMMVFMLLALTPSEALAANEAPVLARVVELPRPLMSVQPFTFNHGKPFLAERDPVTGALDLRTTPVNSENQNEFLYYDFEESGEKVDRKDGINFQNQISPLVSSKESELHKFLNLPVHYASSGKYPLISSSYANTKIQGHASNHRPASSTTTTTPSTIQPSYYPLRTTVSTTVKPKYTSTTSTTQQSPLYEYEYEYDYSEKPKIDYEFLDSSSETGTSKPLLSSSESPRPFSEKPLEEENNKNLFNQSSIKKADVQLPSTSSTTSEKYNINDKPESEYVLTLQSETVDSSTTEEGEQSTETQRLLNKLLSKLSTTEPSVNSGDISSEINKIQTTIKTQTEHTKKDNARKPENDNPLKTESPNLNFYESSSSTVKLVHEQPDADTSNVSESKLSSSIVKFNESNKLTGQHTNNDNQPLSKPEIVLLRPFTLSSSGKPPNNYDSLADSSLLIQNKSPSSIGNGNIQNGAQSEYNTKHILEVMLPPPANRPHLKPLIYKHPPPLSVSIGSHPTPFVLYNKENARPQGSNPGTIVLNKDEKVNSLQSLSPPRLQEDLKRPNSNSSIPQNFAVKVTSQLHHHPITTTPHGVVVQGHANVQQIPHHPSKPGESNSNLSFIRDQETHYNIGPDNILQAPFVWPYEGGPKGSLKHGSEGIVRPNNSPYAQNTKQSQSQFSFPTQPRPQITGNKKKPDEDTRKGIGTVEAVSFGKPSKVQSHLIQISPGQQHPSYSLQSSFSIGMHSQGIPHGGDHHLSHINFPDQVQNKKFPRPPWESHVVKQSPQKKRQPLPNILPQFRPNAKVGYVEAHHYVREPLDTLQPPPLPSPQHLHAEELVHRRNGQSSSSRVTTLQMLQGTSTRGTLRAEEKEEPVFVVYPSNRGEGVVVGTRGPQKPVPPDNLDVDQLDSFPLESEAFQTRMDTPILKGKPSTKPTIKNEFPYPLIKPNLEEVSKESTTEKEYKEYSPTVSTLEKDSNAEINVIPYLQDYMPFATKKPQSKEPLWAMLSENKPISVTLNSKPNLPATETLPNHKPLESQTTTLDFQAPFHASLTAPNKGWSVVGKKPEKNSTTLAQPTTTIPTPETTAESKFDLQNFKPQLFGGFKPIVPIKNDDVPSVTVQS